MRKTLYLRSLFCLLLLFMGINAWADEVTVTKTVNDLVTANSWTVSSGNTIGTLATSFTLDDVVTVSTSGEANCGSIWGTTSGSTTTYDWRLYQNKGGDVTLTVPSGYELVSATFTFTVKNTGALKDGTTALTSGTAVALSGSSKTFTVGNSGSATNGQVKITQFSVTYKQSSGSQTTSASAPSLTTAGVFTTSTYDVTITNNESGATVYYTTDSSSNTAVATVNATTGAVTLVAAGTTTIKASYAGDNTYKASDASYTLTVGKVYASLADLVAGGAPTTAGTAVKVTLTNETIQSIVLNSAGNSRVGIMLKSGNQDVEIYKYGVPDTWAANGTVSGTITGSWVLYGSTWEISLSDWSQLTYTASSLTNQTVTLGTYKTAMTVGDAADTFTATTDGDGALSVKSSNENAATATISNGTVTVTPVAAGTTTITVTAAATNKYNEGSKSYTLTVSAVAKAADLPFSFDGGKSDIESTTGMSQTGLGSDYSASPKLKFDDEGDELIINYGADAGKLSYKIKGNGFSGGTFDVMESANGTDYTSVKSYTELSSTSTESVILTAASRYVKFVYTKKSSGNVALGAISILAANVVDDPGLAFEKSKYSFLTTNDDKAVKATSAKGSTGAITYALTTGDADKFLIDENTGDIVCETAGTYTVTATIAAVTGYSTGTATCTVVVKEPAVANSIIVAEVEDANKNKTYFAMTNTAGDKYITSVQIAKVGDKYYVSEDVLNTIKYATTTTEGKTTIIALNGQYLQATAAKNVSFTDDEYEWTNNEGVLTAANSAYGTLQYNTSNPRFTTYTSKVGQYATIVSLDDVTTIYSRSEENGKFGTICFPYTFVNEGCTVYSAELNDAKNSVVLTEVSDPVAGTPYIFLASADKQSFLFGGQIVAAPVESSPLVGLFVDTKAPIGTYVLQTHEEGQKFYKVTDADHQPTVDAYKAYLEVPSSSKSVSINFSDDATGINALNALVNGDAKIYDINGRQLPTLQKGINIVNGVKVLVK